MRTLLAHLRAKVLGRGPVARFQDMALNAEQAEARRSAEAGEAERLFFANRGRQAAKWVHYLPVYDRVLAPYRGRSVGMLEIGVFQGGSIELWRDYLGPAATIFGIDTDPACAQRVDAPNHVRIGSQSDPAFLKGVVQEMGMLDVVLDDGSHVAWHQRTAFKTLWPLLRPGGVYMIEDAHTSYWLGWGGGYRRRGTAIELAKELIDDQHAFFHDHKVRHANPGQIGTISIDDSLIAIHKIDRQRPGHYGTGTPS